MILSVMTVKAELNDGVVRAFTFDADNNTTIHDLSDNQNGTKFGDANYQTSGCKLGGGCFSFEWDRDYINTQYTLSEQQNFTVSFWVAENTSRDYQRYMADMHGDSRSNAFMIQRIGGIIFDRFDGGSVGVNWSIRPMFYEGVDQDVYYHYVMSTNGSGFKLYINGTLVNESTEGYVENVGRTLLFGSDGGSGDGLDGYGDELVMWDRPLDDDGCTVGNVCGGEIAQLYNSSDGSQYPFPSTNALEIDFYNQSPSNESEHGFFSLNASLNFTFNVTTNTDDFVTCNLTEDSVTVNSTVFQTNVTTLHNITRIFNESMNFTNFEYGLICNNSGVTASDTLNKTIGILIDLNQPFINISSPLNDSFFTNLDCDTVPVNVTFEDDNLYNTTVQILYPNGTVFQSWTNESHNETSFTVEDTIDICDEVVGFWNVTARGCDGHTKQKIDEWEDITVDGSDKSIDFGNCRIWTDALMKDIGFYGYDYHGDRYTWTYEWLNSDSSRSYFLECRDDQELIYLPDSEYQGHFIHGNRWIDFETEEDYPVIITKLTDHKYKVTYIVGEDADPFMTTRSIGELNCNNKTNRFLNSITTSLQGVSNQIAEFVLDSSVYVPVENVTLELLSPRHLIFSGDGQVVKQSHPDASTMWVRLTIDDNVTLYDTPIVTVEGLDDYKVFTLPYVDVDLNTGNHSILIEVRETGTGSINVTDMEVSAVTNQSHAGTFFKHDHILINESLNSTSFVNIGNFTLNKTVGVFKSTTSVDLHMTVEPDTDGTTTECYVRNFNTSEQSVTFKRTADSGVTGSSGIFSMSPNRTTDLEVWGLYCRNDIGSTTAVNISGVAIEMRDSAENIIPTRNTKDNTSAVYTAGVTKIGSINITPFDSGVIGVATSVYPSSITGVQDGLDSPVFFFNSSNQTNSTLCYGERRRSFQTSDSVATIKYLDSCLLPVGQNATIDFYVNVSAGNSINLTGYDFSALEFENLNTTIEPLPPIPAGFLTPSNNSQFIVGTDNRTATWNAFSDPEGSPIIYNLSVRYLNETIITYDDNLSVEFRHYMTDTLDIGNYKLVVEGCDNVSLCSESEVFFEMIDFEPVMTLTLSNTVIIQGTTVQNVTWSITDNNINYTNLTVITPSSNVLFSSVLENGTQQLSNFTELGTYSVTFFTQDDEGDNESLVRTFTVQTSLGTGEGTGEWSKNDINSSVLLHNIPRSVQESFFLLILIILCIALTVFATHDKSRGWWLISATMWVVLGVVFFNYTFAFGLILTVGGGMMGIVKML